MNVLVITGSRKGWPRPDEIRALVRAADVLIVGDAAGVDAFARREADATHVYVNKFVAHWDDYGSSAGPLRNRAMAERAAKFRDDGATVVCHAFPNYGSHGTWDCVRRLRDVGFTVTIHEWGKP